MNMCYTHEEVWVAFWKVERSVLCLTQVGLLDKVVVARLEAEAWPCNVAWEVICSAPSLLCHPCTSQISSCSVSKVQQDRTHSGVDILQTGSPLPLFCSLQRAACSDFTVRSLHLILALDQPQTLRLLPRALFSIQICLFYVRECLTCMCACALHTCLVPVEARKWYWIL